MKKFCFVRTGIVLLTALLVLGMAACSSPSSSEPGSSDLGETRYTDPDSAVLESVIFAGVEDAELGTPAATAGAATAGSVTVYTKTGVPIEIKSVSRTERRDPGASVFVDIGNGAEVEWGVVANVATFTDSDLWPEANLDFTAGQVVVIKSVSHDGSEELYYVINVTLVELPLESITVTGTGTEVHTLTGNTLPTPASTWVRAVPVQMLFADEQPASGFGIAVVAEDIDDDDDPGTPDVATVVEWAKATAAGGITQTLTFGNDANIVFDDTDSLVVRITHPTISTAAAFFRVVINLRQDVVIPYIDVNGNPASYINFNATPGTKPANWSTAAGPLNIRKIYIPDGNPGNDYLIDPTTTGQGYVMFDEDGLYVYVKVTDDDVSPTGVTSQHHQVDSVEIFINENYVAGTNNYATSGSQYRIGANGEVSGDPEARVPPVLEALKTQNLVKSRKITGGYEVIARLPWNFLNQYPLVSDGTKEIGLELQINETQGSVSSTRRCTMVWNNIASSNYQNSSQYALGVLDATAITLKVNALEPTFTATPASSWYHTNAIDGVLSATATASDGGTISYEWFQTNSWTGTGTAAIGTGPTLNLSTLSLTEGTYYFYARAKNDNPSATGSVKVNYANSVPARIQIFAAGEVVVERLSLINNYAIYKFDLPAGAEYGDYSLVSVDYKLDTANLAKGIRSFRLMGNYLASDFARSGDRRLVAAWETYNAAYIYDDRGSSYVDLANRTADEWFTLALRLGQNGNTASPNAGFNAANKPAATATGPFFFGLGIPGTDGYGDNAPGEGDAVLITQLVKDVKLIHKDNLEADGVTLKTVGYDPAKDVVSKGSGLGGTAFTGNEGKRLNAADRIYQTEGTTALTVTTIQMGSVAPTVVGDHANDPADTTMVITVGGDNTVTVVNTESRKNGGLGYLVSFPDNLAAYDKVEIYYTAVITGTTMNGVSQQLTTRIGAANAMTAGTGNVNNLKNYEGASNSEYRTVSAGTDQIWEAKASDLAPGGVVADGIGLQVNNWGNAAGDTTDVNFTFKITKIVLTP